MEKNNVSNKILEKEEERLKKWIPKVIEDFRKKGIKNIVALDKSGRPIGLLVWKTWKKMYPNEKPELFFMDPHNLKIYSKFGDKKTAETESYLRVHSKILKEEHPKLFKKLQKKEKIGVVDETVFRGITKESVTQFFQRLLGKDNFAFFSFSESVFNAPTWYGKFDLLGVEGTDAFFSKKKFVSQRSNLDKVERQNFIKFRKEIENLARKIAAEKKQHELKRKASKNLIQRKR